MNDHRALAWTIATLLLQVACGSSDTNPSPSVAGGAGTPGKGQGGSSIGANNTGGSAAKPGEGDAAGGVPVVPGTGGTPQLGTGGSVDAGGRSASTGGLSTGGSSVQPATGGSAGGNAMAGAAGAPSARADLCTKTGGSIGTSQCCQSANDFPSSCMTGACGCAPANSKAVSTCTCPSGKCFDPAVGCK